MTDTVITRTYTALPPPDRREILRYAGVRTRDPERETLLAACLQACATLTGRVCFLEVPLHWTERGLRLGTIPIESHDLARALEGCDRALLFAATVGIDIDRLIARYTHLSPARALLFQAIGAERIEALCEKFCQEQSAAYAADGRQLRPRFSPGYGDLPLTLQREIFALLDCSRHIGLTLTDSLLMAPTKSVTAIAGLGDPRDVAQRGCADCGKKECPFRTSTQEGRNVP